MRSYRLYLLDSSGGFVDVVCHDAEGDQQAIEAAGELLSRSPGVEIWEGSRFVSKTRRSLSDQSSAPATHLA